jgi:hypothetical protein
MNQAFPDLFQEIRFFPDVFDRVNADVPPLQQPDRLLPACFSIDIGAFGLGMKFVFGHNIAVRFHPTSIPTLLIRICRNSEVFSRILINPVFLQPLAGIRFIRAN